MSSLQLSTNDLFEQILSVSSENIDSTFLGATRIPWSDFFLNPRRLRGSDFLMRWSQGVWSEQRLIEAVQNTNRFFALPYGPSSIAPTDDIREFELYFEKLEQAGLGQLKRPDLLVFRQEDTFKVNQIIANLGGIQKLPFISEEDTGIQALITLALVAIECENSLWVARDMPDYGAELKPKRRLGGKPGLNKAAVLPTVILKEEDRTPLKAWQQQRGLGIHIWHAFYDLAFGISLDQVEHVINNGYIEPTIQKFQAPGGATSTKTIYKVYYHYAYPLGHATEAPELVADSIKDKNGHILPYVTFSGGNVQLSKEALNILEQLSTNKES